MSSGSSGGRKKTKYNPIPIKITPVTAKMTDESAHDLSAIFIGKSISGQAAAKQSARYVLSFGVALNCPIPSAELVDAIEIAEFLSSPLIARMASIVSGITMA